MAGSDGYGKKRAHNGSAGYSLTREALKDKRRKSCVSSPSQVNKYVGGKAPLGDIISPANQAAVDVTDISVELSNTFTSRSGKFAATCLMRKTRVGSGEDKEKTMKEVELRLERMEGAVRTLLECMGEDVGREGLLNTPSRHAKALLFLTKGYHLNVDDVVNDALFHENHTGMMHIGYMPSGTIMGLSKFPRIAEVFSRRLQVQERLTKQVANAINDKVKPKGVVVIMESSHLCMVVRGVEKTSAMARTTCMLGCYETSTKLRNEFFNLISMK
ncbi:hypothetical protein G7046_g3873 [Stylonectria norvegica]|nr:hypothetical protein G7046_g3873 [Stylonectria norvegica]